MEKRQRRGLFRGSFFLRFCRCAPIHVPVGSVVTGSVRAASARRSLTAGASATE